MKCVFFLFFFDFKKAFDSVPHCDLIGKLQDLQVNHLLVKWIYSYLSDRNQQVVVGGSSSDALPVVWSPTRISARAIVISVIHQWNHIYYPSHLKVT